MAAAIKDSFPAVCLESGIGRHELKDLLVSLNPTFGTLGDQIWEELWRAASSRGEAPAFVDQFLEFVFKDFRPGAVIFDCDGTFLDTEKLRSEVTFLLLAPYIPGLEKQRDGFDDWKEAYIMKAAGRSFKQKVADVDEQRRVVGMKSIAESWASASDKGTSASVSEAVTARRVAMALSPTPGASGLLEAKQAEDDAVLRQCSEPCAGMPEVVIELCIDRIPFNIASTSSRDSLEASLKCAGLLETFQPATTMIHSGDSDFDPPAHKPKPDVYLKAAKALGVSPQDSVAVEDSDTGVGSAANAGMGLIVGYVGGGQIPYRMRDKAAKQLLAGARSENGRGADIVISHAKALPRLVKAWRSGSLLLPLEKSFLQQLPADVDAWSKYMDLDTRGALCESCGAEVVNRKRAGKCGEVSACVSACACSM